MVHSQGASDIKKCCGQARTLLRQRPGLCGASSPSVDRPSCSFSASDDARLPAGISAEPAYSLERNSANKTLTVVAHLISPNAPRAKAGATWDKARTITLGMMAAPAKPQPSNPASSARRWWPATAGSKDPRPAFKDDLVTAELVGNSMYWGTHANDV